MYSTECYENKSLRSGYIILCVLKTWYDYNVRYVQLTQTTFIGEQIISETNTYNIM